MHFTAAMKTSVIASLALASVVLASQPARSAEIKVLSLPGMMTVLDELGPKFERATGHKLAISFVVPNPLLKRIEDGERFDVVIIGTSETGAPEIDRLIDQGKVAASSRTAIARIGVGVWVRPDAPKPDISTVAAFKQTLLAAKSISYTAESGTGRYIAGLMTRLGIADEMKPKTKPLRGGGQNPHAVAAGEVEYGISVVSDGIGLPGVALLGLLPPEIQRWSDFAAGVSSQSGEPAAARAFIQFLASPENSAVFKAKGFEPVAK